MLIPIALLGLVLESLAQAAHSAQPSSSSSSPSQSSWTTGFEAPRASFLETVLEGSSANQKSCKPTGLIEDACCDYESVEEVNSDLATRLKELIQLPFFRYQKVDLFRDCPFWQEDAFCMNRACAVQETDEDHIPEPWRSGNLGKVEEVKGFPGSLEGALFRNSDFCVLDDSSADSEGIYVDLYENPERFTGYAGESASKVWKAIYEENCFDKVHWQQPARDISSGGSGYIGQSLISDNLKGGKGIKGLVGNLGLQSPRDAQDEEQCLEKRVYYRLISGLHASISIHICSEYLDQSTGLWTPNLPCFITRIAQHPERLQNVYFNYVMMLRALTKAAPYLRAYDYSTGDKEVDEKTVAAVNGILDKAESCTATFDETSMFGGSDGKPLLEEFKSHFRNVSRIMDCVGCDKCRLWGKTQITGVATGLKLLFTFDDASPSSSASSRMAEVQDLRHSEIVSFIWTIHRFSESLEAVESFRRMWAEQKEEVRTRQPTQEEIKADAMERPVKKEAQQEVAADDRKEAQKSEPPAEAKQQATKPDSAGSRAGGVSDETHDPEFADQGIFSPSPSASKSAPVSMNSSAYHAPARPPKREAAAAPSSSFNQQQQQQTPQNSSRTTRSVTEQGLGPRTSGLLEKLLDACRSSIVACITIVERGMAFVVGSFTSVASESGSKVEL